MVGYSSYSAGRATTVAFSIPRQSSRLAFIGGGKIVLVGLFSLNSAAIGGLLALFLFVCWICVFMHVKHLRSNIRSEFYIIIRCHPLNRVGYHGQCSIFGSCLIWGSSGCARGWPIILVPGSTLVSFHVWFLGDSYAPDELMQQLIDDYQGDVSPPYDCYPV